MKSRPDDSRFFAGAGDLGDLIATFDWPATSLGPISAWPACVRTTVGMALKSPVPIALLLGEDGIILYNDAYRPIAGQRHPVALGAAVREAWPEMAAFNDHVIRTVLAGGSLSYRNQELTLCRNGADEQVWLNLDYSPIPDDSGVPVGVIVFVAETTDQVRIKREVAGQRERLQQMFEQAPSFMALLRGPEHVFDLANAACLRLLGRRDVIGRTVREALPDLAGQGYVELLDGVYRTGEPFVGNALTVALQRSPDPTPDERVLNFIFHPLRDGDRRITGIFVEGNDVTDRVSAERAQRQSEAQFRIFAESMPNHVWAAAPDGRLDWFNSRVYEYSGATQGTLDGAGWTALVHPDDLPEAGARWAHALAEGEPYEVEFRLRRADGVFRRHLARAVLIRDGEGRPTRWIGTNTDIEDQTRIEKALTDSELRLRLSQQAAGIASIEVDIASGRVYGSDTLWPLWGLPQAESVHISVLENMVIAEDQAVRSTEATRRAGTSQPNVEYRIRTADTGEIRWIARHIEFLSDRAGTPTKMFGVMRDITEEKEAEVRQQLLTHELEHRIKNILATVSAIAAQTLRDTDLETARTALDQRLQALARAHDILNQTRWTSASLMSVIMAAIEPFHGNRIGAEGPEFVIGPRRALSLALAVNELGTNALKYGALSTADGRVEIAWSRSVDSAGVPSLNWRWTETGGPEVVLPQRRGFGQFLLKRVLAADFDGSVGIDYLPLGVVCRLTAPWSEVRGQ